MSQFEAFEELKQCSWIQFDGNLVETFISLLKEIELPDNWYDKFDSVFLQRIFQQVEDPEDFL